MGGLGKLEGGRVRVSLVVVTYFSSADLGLLAASFRREAAAGGWEPEVVVVDHSEDGEEAERLAALEPDRLLVRPNRGYAAGVNLGMAAARGEVLVVANPDVVFLPGSLEPLLGGLEEGFAVVGPRLVWDRAGRVDAPPAGDPSPGALLREAAALRWRRCWERWLPAYLESLVRVWRGSGTVEVPALRGSVMALRREDALRLGPLDEGYFLYYEETEWLLAARRRGARLGLATGAPVHHGWGRSTARLQNPAALEARSRRRFLRRNADVVTRLAITVLERKRWAGIGARPVAGPEDLAGREAELWLLAPSPHLLPAFGIGGRAELPAEVARAVSRGRWYLVEARRNGGRWSLGGAWSWGPGDHGRT